MNINPLHDRVVIKPLEQEQTSAGGILIPDNAKEKPMEGKVVAVGPGKRYDSGDIVSLAVTVGDKVLYGKYSGTEVKLEGEEYVVMREDDIIGIIK